MRTHLLSCGLVLFMSSPATSAEPESLVFPPSRIDPEERVFELDRQRVPDLSAIDIVEYFRGLLTGAARVVGARALSVRNTGGPFHLKIERALPLGLLVNELVTNAFKYGRRGNAAPSVEVVVEHDAEKVRITVSDDGPGFPEGFEPVTTRTLGLYLVNQLARQLDGAVRFEKTPTRCILEFPRRDA